MKLDNEHNIKVTFGEIPAFWDDGIHKEYNNSAFRRICGCAITKMGWVFFEVGGRLCGLSFRLADWINPPTYIDSEMKEKRYRESIEMLAPERGDGI